MDEVEEEDEEEEKMNTLNLVKQCLYLFTEAAFYCLARHKTEIYSVSENGTQFGSPFTICHRCLYLSLSVRLT